jgi:formyltetrahydrofolate synthetase
LGQQAIIALREPSLGGFRNERRSGGGAMPRCAMESINLHFSGDIHAVTAANNLLAALMTITFSRAITWESIRARSAGNDVLNE